MIQIVEDIVELLYSLSLSAKVRFKFEHVNAELFLAADLVAGLQSEEPKSTAQEVASFYAIVLSGMTPYRIELTMKGWWRSDWSIPDPRCWLNMNVWSICPRARTRVTD